MGAFATDLELTELILRILCDTDPLEPADAVCLFSQTPDNEESVLSRTAELFSSGKVKMVAFGQGGRLVTGEVFRLDWREKLLRLDVPQEAIVSVEITSELAHTHTEAIALVSHARQKRWETVYVISHPLHQLRAFVNIISIVLHGYPQLKVFNKVGTSQPWAQKVVHSQNIERGTRSTLVKAEWDRILRYHEKGDLVSAREVLDYLNRRDS